MGRFVAADRSFCVFELIVNLKTARPSPFRANCSPRLTM
jgi:hypothetical protein